MLRLSSILVAICMLLIAGSVGIVTHLSYGFTRVDAAVLAIATLAVLALLNAASTRARDRADIGEQIADLSRATADLGRKAAEIERRLEIVETGIEGGTTSARAVTEPLAAEIEHLGTRVSQLADSVAVHDRALRDRAATSATPAASPAAHGERGELATTKRGNAAADLGRERSKGMDRDAIIAAIRQAVEADRMDLYAQPIVSLPQRKVRYYEASARLRTASGEELPADHRDHAHRAGLVPMLDNRMLLRCVQVVRGLDAKNRDVRLFCPIAGETLIDSEFFPRISEFLHASRAVASSLVLKLAQRTVRALGPLESKSLAGLTEMGFHFCMDGITDLRLEPDALAGRGFRFVKIPAALLLSRTGPAIADVHPADFSNLFGRVGVDLIAERIENEGMLVNLLDFNVRFGQGALFSPPRLVRADLLPGLADRAPAAEPERAVEAQAPRSGTEEAVSARDSDSIPGLPRADGLSDVLAQLARGVVRRA
jgi:cyclic-di-GMP phosphodiesterase TipF (flagellum assembly factor)